MKWFIIAMLATVGAIAVLATLPERGPPPDAFDRTDTATLATAAGLIVGYAGPPCNLDADPKYQDTLARIRARIEAAADPARRAQWRDLATRGAALTMLDGKAAVCDKARALYRNLAYGR